MNNKSIKLRVFSGCVMVLLVSIIACTYFFVDNTAVAVDGVQNQPIYNGSRNENRVALMFNCYEGAEIIEKIAKILEKNGFCATFFFGGCFADDNVDLIKMLIEGGHEIGNHGYFHKDHSKLDYDGNMREIKNTHELILAQTGIVMNLFAPPSGAFSKTTLSICEKLHYKMILWSVDTIDWRDKSEKIVYNRATKNISGGDLVLMHPKEHTLKALPEILKYYVERGLVVTTVTQCLESDG